METDCNEILRIGLLETVTFESGRSVSSSVVQYIRTLDYQQAREFVQRTARGDVSLSFGLHNGEIAGNFTEEEFEEWKRDETIFAAAELSEAETIRFVSVAADEETGRRWVECLKITSQDDEPDQRDEVGLVCRLDGNRHDRNILFRAKWIPNSMEDYNHTVVRGGFTVTGADILNSGLPDETEIPHGGITVQLGRRNREEVVVVLNTTKGSFSGRVDAPVNLSGIELRHSIRDNKHWDVSIDGPEGWEGAVFRVRYELCGNRKMYGTDTPHLKKIEVVRDDESEDSSRGFAKTLTYRLSATKKISAYLDVKPVYQDDPANPKPLERFYINPEHSGWRVQLEGPDQNKCEKEE